jgi:Zn finger protein HypA/HybF involved in hydrogenase expression
MATWIDYDCNDCGAWYSVTRSQQPCPECDSDNVDRFN